MAWWYILAANKWYNLAAKRWYNFAANEWYISVRKLTLEWSEHHGPILQPG